MGRVISVDLAYRSYGDIGVALLEGEGVGEILARPLRVSLSGEPRVEVLAAWLNDACETHGARTLLLDGPSAWRGPDVSPDRSPHARLAEQRLATPGKTGLPGECKPRSYLGFTRFSIDLFEQLLAFGWQFAMAPDRPAVGVRTVIESFPTAAWRALGRRPLPGKSRAGRKPEALEAARDALASLGVRIDGPTTHDELQAIVAGIAGVRWAAGAREHVTLCGEAPFHLDGCWREGYIVLPS